MRLTVPGAGYLVAIFAVGVVVVLRLALTPILGRDVPLLLFVLAVVAAAWQGGLGAALFATALSAIAGSYFFVEGRGWQISEPAELARIGIFWIVGVLISILFDLRRRALRQAEESGQLLRVTMASMSDAVITTDSHGRVTFLKGVAENLTGWSCTEASRLPLEAVFRIVDETSRLPVENLVTKAVRDGRAVGLASQTILIAKNGKEWAIDGTASPIWDAQGEALGAVLVFRDVSERRRQDRELQSQERQFHMLAESIPHLAWMANPDGHIFWYNRRWYDYTGSTPEQMQGWGWQAVHDPAELPKVLERWAASLATGQPFEMTFPLRGRDGGFRQFLTRVEPLKNAEGRVVRWFGTNTDISDAKRTEEELRDARSRLESTLAAGEIGTWEFDVVGNSVRADENLVCMFGVRFSEDANEPLEAYQRAIHPDDRERVSEIIGRALDAGEGYEVECRLIGSGGDIRSVVARGRVERDVEGRALRLPGVVMDITGRRQAEARGRLLLEEAATANAKFRAFFDQGALFAGIMDLDGTIIEPNRLSWEGCGFTRDQILGKPFWEGPWWTPSVALVERVKAASAEAASGVTYRAEMPYFVADGSDRIVDLIILPIKDESGRVIFLAPTGTDITERRRLEEDLRRLAANLSEASHRKDEFLATLAHELRNPLAPIRNGLELMRLASDEPEVVEQARSLMERQLNQLVRLVDDLMDLSRITRGKIELHKERILLADVVNSAVETSRPLIDEMDHQLTVTLPEQPITVNADLTRLSQAFMNLLNNAAKYSDRGGHIWLTAEREGTEFVVSIKDTGIGIAADQMPHIFEMFTQVEHSLEKSQGGLGIGLTLVKRLVEMHGGRITANSEGPDRGSEFIVRLPIVIESPEPAIERGNDEPVASSTRTILVVDDNKDGAESLATMLRHSGNEVHTAHDGLEAVELAESLRPDALLLDIGLPKLNGYEVCRRIREQNWGKDVLLIAVTGWGQEEDRNRSQAFGFDHHLVKPLDPKALMKLLAESPRA